MLKGYEDSYIANLDGEFAQFVEWGRSMGAPGITGDLLNFYIAQVCFARNSAYKAKQVRASCALYCDLFGIPKVHNSATFRLVKSAERSKSKRHPPALSIFDVLPLFECEWSLEVAILRLFFTAGIRPFEIAGLSSGCIHGDTLWTVRAKGFCSRPVLLSPLALQSVKWLRSNMKLTWWKGSKQDRDSLCLFMKKLLKRPFTLREARVFFATWTHQLGVASAFLMKQMNHLWWHCTLGYIRLPEGEAQPRWQVSSLVPDRFVLYMDWVHADAFSFDLQHPAQFNSWLSGVRKALSGGLVDDDEGVLSEGEHHEAI